MADEFDDLSSEETEALREHLAKLRKKQALEAKLKAAKAEAAKLTEELDSLDDIEMSEGDQWERIERMTPEERHEEAKRQRKLAEDFRREQEIVGPGFPRSEFLRRAWGQEGEDAQAHAVEAELERQGSREGIMPRGHGRVARRAEKVNEELGEKHEPGKLSNVPGKAQEVLGPNYQGNVRVIKHQFKHRAWNPRTRVDDKTLPELRKKNPRMDDDQ